MHLLAVGGQAEKHYIEGVYTLALYTHNEEWEIANAYLLLLYIVFYHKVKCYRNLWYYYYY